MDEISRVTGNPIAWFYESDRPEASEPISAPPDLVSPPSGALPTEHSMQANLSKLTDALVGQQQDIRSLIQLLADNQKSLERQQDLFERTLDQREFESRRMASRITDLEKETSSLKRQSEIDRLKPRRSPTGQLSEPPASPGSAGGR